MSDSTPETLDELREKWRGFVAHEAVDFEHDLEEYSGPTTVLIVRDKRNFNVIVRTHGQTEHERCKRADAQLTALRDALAPGYEECVGIVQDLADSLAGGGVIVRGSAIFARRARAALEAATHASTDPN